MPNKFCMHNVDPKAFIEALDRCTGKVMLVTDDGDQFNLKSTLSQLAGLVKIIEGGNLVKACIICENMEDESKMFRLNMFGDKK